MQPLDFLAVVLPSAGHGKYCVAELSKKKEHFCTDNFEEFGEKIAEFTEKGYDTYVGMATFKEQRSAKDAQYLRAFFLDLDCNHKLDIPDAKGVVAPKDYPSAKDAYNATLDMLEKTGLGALGQPWFASSGSGVHVYWPLSQDIEAERWKIVAENFKSLLIQVGMRIDTAVPSDTARLMRTVDSQNNGVKAGKKVRGATRSRFISKGDVFEFEAFAKVVREKLVGPSYEEKRSLVLEGSRPKGPASDLSKRLMANNVTSFKTIWLKSALGTGCAQLKGYLDDPKRDGLEPVWRGLLSWAKCCEADGWDTALELSELHPYDRERTATKWDEIKGPYPCLKMDSENPGVCTSCKHFGKLTNPLVLGRELATDNTEKVIEVAPKPKQEDDVEFEDVSPEMATEVHLPTHTVTRPTPPRGFSYGRTGGVYMQKKDEDADGEKVTKEIPLLPYDLFVVRILRNQKEHQIQLAYCRPTGVEEIMLPQKAVVSKDETVKTLAMQNVVALFGSGNDKNLFEYVRSCVNDASTNHTVTRVPEHYGWQEDDTFVHANKIFAKNKNQLVVPMADLDNLNVATAPVGSVENWQKVMRMMVAKKRYDILSIFLTACAAPLMRFTGMAGVTFHYASTGSGTGKSLGMLLGSSFWGRGKPYMVSRQTSGVAMTHRLGLLHSEPLIVDEVTQNNRDTDMEWLPSFLFDVSEGKGKERMESGSNRERVNSTYWNSIAMVSSNTQAVDYLTGLRTHSSEGELRRVLELSMEQEVVWTDEELETLSLLEKNCAVAAPIYIQYLVDHTPEIAQLTRKMLQKCYKDLDASNDERFWMAGVAASMMAGLLLSSRHTGLIDLPLSDLFEVYKQMVFRVREYTRKGRRAAKDILNAYIREKYGKLLFVDYTLSKSRPEFSLGGLDRDEGKDESITRTEIAGRVEKGKTPGHLDFYIEVTAMRAFCAKYGFGFADFMKGLKAQHNVDTVQKNMTSGTKAPVMRVNALRITQDASQIDEELPMGED